MPDTPPPHNRSEWSEWQIALQLDSPLHAGHRTLGNLKQTRPYVTGSTLWGSMAARIGRDYHQGNYTAAEKEVQEDLRFTYLFPSTAPDRVTLWPWGESAAEFAWNYLSSYTSTALADGRSKLDGSLHEIEHILPVTRSGAPVFLLGYLWIARDANAEWTRPEKLRKLLERMQLGGERRYGAGRIREAFLARAAEGAGPIFDDWRYIADSGGVVLSASSTRPPAVCAHVLASPETHRHFRYAQLEPLLLRRIRAAGPASGHGLTEPKVCWTPGSRVRDASALRFEIGQLGVWRCI